MARGKWILAALVLVAVLGVGWHFGSPAYTLSQMKSAAESGNTDKLASYIDFPALREDLKADLLAQMMAEAQKDQSGLNGLAMAIGPALVGSMVDGFVTPAGMKAALSSQRATDVSASATSGGTAEPFKLEDEPVITRRGMSEFLVGTQKDPTSGMVFKRSELGWKLSGVELPPTRASK